MNPADTYDQVPYTAHSVPQMHPDHIAIAGLLRGLRPARLSRCRVLELGCADGSHLLPLAACWPNSHFVGIDRSQVQIEKGQIWVRDLGLPNLELRAVDLMDVEDEGEGFDYILAHGLYSWVPPQVAARVLQICGRRLAPGGLAYISYNLHPGFYRRQPIMEMMRYHTANIPDPAQRVAQGRALLGFLIDSAPDPDSITTRILREEQQRIESLPDSYVFHEHFESDNRACYFHEFMREARAHALQYVGDAVITLGLQGLSATARQTFAQLDQDSIQQEQYLDFLRGSFMRSSILCRSDATLTAEPSPESLQDLWVLGAAVPTSMAPLEGNNLRLPIPVKFHARLGEGQIENPAFKALLLALLRSRPAALTLPQLGAQMSALLGEAIPPQTVLQLAVYGHRTGVCMLRQEEVPIQRQVSPHPRTSRLAQLQAQRLGRVTGPWHDPIRLDAIQQIVLPLLDGTRDHEGILQGVLQAIGSGALRVSGPQGEPADLDALAKDLRASHLPKTLQQLANLGLLQG